MATPSPTPYIKDIYSTDSAGSIAGFSVIRSLHDFYHYGSDDFDVSDRSYLESVVGFLFAIAAIGVLLMIFQWLFQLCSRCQCFRNCCECCFSFTKNGGRCTVVFLFILAAAAASVSYFGRNEFQTAASDIGDDLYQLAEAFDGIETSVSDLVTLSVEYNETVHATNCTPASITQQFVSATNSFSSAVMNMDDLVGGISNKIDLAGDFFKDEVPAYIDQGIGLVVLCVYVLVLLGMIAVCTRWTCDDCIVTFLGSLVLLLLIVLIALEVTISVTIADFCYAGPDEAILTAADKSGLDDDTIDVISYYIKCNGTSPLDTYFNQSEYAIGKLNSTLAAVSKSNIVTCDSTELTALGDLNDQTLDELDTLSSNMECPSFSAFYTSIFYDIICDEFVKGLLILWGTQVIAGMFLYCAFCVLPCASRSERARNGNKIFADDMMGLKYEED